MKKVIVIGIVMAMVMCLAGMANAYILGGSAVNSAGSAAMTNLQFSDAANSASPQPTAVGGTVEMALATNQSWLPVAGATAQTWNYKLFQKPAPAAWTIAIWGNDFAASTAHVRFWVTNIGNGTSTGANITGQTWELKNLATGAVAWTGLVNAAKTTEANAWIDVTLAVVNTTTPHINAAAYSLGQQQVVPEPGSLLALGSGLVGLVGFAIRRRS